jgi:hypothetical protein
MIIAPAKRVNKSGDHRWGAVFQSKKEGHPLVAFSLIGHFDGLACRDTKTPPPAHLVREGPK